MISSTSGRGAPQVSYDPKEGTGIIQPKAGRKHTATVLFMHGLGDTAMGWMDAMHFLYERLAQEGHPTRFVLPTAKTRRITINGGMKMPGWYDITGLDERAKEDFDGIEQSYDTVSRILRSEMEDEGIPPNKIFLGGFSQGAAMSLYSCYFKQEQTLGGVIALSGYLPFAYRAEQLVQKQNKTPLLMCHGLDDGVVLYPWAKGSFDQLKKCGVEGEFKTYPDLAHSASEEELDDVLTFIRQRLQS